MKQGSALSERWVCLLAPQYPMTNYGMNFYKDTAGAPQLFYACPCVAHKWSGGSWILGYSEGDHLR